MTDDLIVGDEIRLLEAMVNHKSLMFFDRLEELGLVTRYPSGYEITPSGREVLGAVTNRELPLVTGPCTCDSEECCQGSRPQPPAYDEISAHNVELRDILDDLTAGFDHWKDTKVSSGAWDAYDEHFSRWVEAGPLSEG